jgi:hypothetical protein
LKIIQTKRESTNVRHSVGLMSCSDIEMCNEN